MEKKRHELLKLLSIRCVEIQLGKIKENGIGVSYEEICKSLDCDRHKLYEISNLLYDEKEIDYFDAYNIKGLYAKSKGITSYTDKKYLKLKNSRIKNNIKDIVSIVIPVLSLLIALFTIWYKVDTINSKNEIEIKEIKEKLEIQEGKINNIKKND